MSYIGTPSEGFSDLILSFEQALSAPNVEMEHVCTLYQQVKKAAQEVKGDLKEEEIQKRLHEAFKKVDVLSIRSAFTVDSSNSQTAQKIEALLKEEREEKNVKAFLNHRENAAKLSSELSFEQKACLMEACKDIQNGQLLSYIVRIIQSFPQEQRTPATLQWIASSLQDETVAGDTSITFEQLPQEEKTVEILEEIISLFKTMKDQDKYTKAIVITTFIDLPQEERNLQVLKTLLSLLGTMDGMLTKLCIKASCEIQKGKVHFLEALSIVVPFFQGLSPELHNTCKRDTNVAGPRILLAIRNIPLEQRGSILKNAGPLIEKISSAKQRTALLHIVYAIPEEQRASFCLSFAKTLQETLALSPQDLIEACKDIQNGQLLFFIVRTVQSFPQEQRTPATLQWIASTLQDETVAGDTTVTFEQLPQEEKTVEILEEIISLFKTMKDQDKYTKAIVLNTFRDLPQEERNLQALKTLFSLLGTMDGRSAMLCIKASCEIQKGKVHFLEALSIVAPFFQGLPLALHDQQFPLK